MKVVIELNDDTLRHAIENQVDKAVASLSAEVIKAKVDEILSKKFERLTEARIDEVAGIAAAKLLRGDGNQYQIETKVNKALAEAARALVRDQSRKL